MDDKQTFGDLPPEDPLVKDIRAILSGITFAKEYLTSLRSELYPIQRRLELGRRTKDEEHLQSKLASLRTAAKNYMALSSTIKNNIDKLK